MALVETTLGAACAATDASITVASATSVAAGVIIRCDDELMQVAKSYVLASTTVPVLRGRQGTVPTAHPSGAAVEHGLASDAEWGSAAAQISTQFPFVKAARQLSYSASGAITLPSPGADMTAVLNASSTTVLAMTVALPSKAMDGSKLRILSRNGTGAHTITFAGRLNGAGSGNYTVFTFPANPVMIEVVAYDSFWYVTTCPAWTGTVTLLVGGIA